MSAESPRIVGRRVVAWGVLFLGTTGINAFAAPWAAQRIGLRIFVLYPILGLLGLILFVGGAIQWATGRGGFGAERRTPTYMAKWFVFATVALFLCSLLAGMLANLIL